MNKIICASLITVLAIGISINPATVAASSASYTSAESSIKQITTAQELNDLIKLLKKQLKEAKKSGKSKEMASTTRENLTVSSIDVSYPRIGGGTTGVLDQMLEVEVANNQYGSASLSYDKFKYAVYLYEIVDGKKKKLFKAATGEAYVPYANGKSSFKVNMEGGLPYDGKNSEREYIAEVEIDSGNKVKESNEKDNKVWSKSWIMEHYKG